MDIINEGTFPLLCQMKYVPSVKTNTTLRSGHETLKVMVAEIVIEDTQRKHKVVAPNIDSLKI